MPETPPKPKPDDDLDDVTAKLHKKGVEADPYYDLGPAKKLGGDKGKSKPGFLGGSVDGSGGFGGGD